MKELQNYDSPVTEELQTSVLKLISNHYNQHPVISPELQGRSFDIIQKEYISELRTLLANNDHLFQYLLSNWYNADKLRTWGRLNNEREIPMTKTTMTVESHWSVSKRHQHRNYNRPPSDLLVYLIDKKIFPKYEGKLELLLSGRSKPVWWYM